MIRTLTRRHLQGSTASLGSTESDAFDATAAEEGAQMGGGTAAGLFGPEAYPVGAVIGGYIGGHAREWSSGIWDGIKGLFSSTSPCECQLGACNDGGDDTFNLDKYHVLQGQCLSADAQTLIENVVNQQTQALVDRGLIDVNEMNQLRVCMKLKAFAQCRDQNWRPPHPGTPPPPPPPPPPPACLKPGWMRDMGVGWPSCIQDPHFVCTSWSGVMQEVCTEENAATIGWHCTSPEQKKESCLGGGCLPGYTMRPAHDGKPDDGQVCVKDLTPEEQVAMKIANCKAVGHAGGWDPTTGDCIDTAPTTGMSLPKKILVGGALATAGWVAFAYATKRPIVPPAARAYAATVPGKVKAIPAQVKALPEKAKALFKKAKK